MRAFATPALALCLVVACAKSATQWPAVDLKALDRTEYKDAERVVLLDEQTVRFGADPETKRAWADIEIHVRVRSLKANALQHGVGASFDKTFFGRPEIDGRVIYPDGTQKPLDLEKAYEYPLWDSAVLYNDTRGYTVPVPILPKGGVLEFTTRQRLFDLRPFQFRHVLGDDDPTVLSRFTVITPATWELEWTARMLGRPTPLEPQIEVAGAERRYVWQAENVPGHPREQLGIEASLEVPAVVARLKKWESEGKTETAFATAKELSAWQYEKTHTLSEPDAQMRETVKKVLEGAPDDPREKARRLYTYACEKVQYCAIEIGYGGWFPHPATAVQANRYGDCKDKANYLKGLLAVAGVKSRPTMIYSHRGYPLPFSLPSLGANFNHEILTIDLPDGPLLVDPTARTVAFGDLPVSDREATVLPIQEGGAELGTAPAAIPAQHVEKQVFALELREDGFGTGTFEIETTGALAASLRGQLIRSVPSKRREVMSDWLDLHGVKVTQVDDTRGLELVDALGVKGRIDVPRLVLGESGTQLVRLSAFAPRWLPAVDGGDRRTPLVMWNRYKKVGEVRLQLPKSRTVKRAPPPFSRSSKWLDYQLQYESVGGALIARRELTLKERIVPPEELAGLREVLDTIHLAENVPVLLGGAK